MNFENYTIMVVDDIVENIKVAMSHIQQLGCKVTYATSGKQAIARAKNTIPNLILMDVMMPEMDGIETTKQIKQIEELKNIPIIFLTAKSDINDLEKGFEVGGVDYITKPFEGMELLARIKSHLELSIYRNDLEKQIQIRTYEIEKLKSSIIEAMGSLAEYRDNETGAHIRRTQHYVKLLCKHLQKNEKYSSIINNDYIELLFNSAPLHDIGKVGIQDSILLKPAKLTPEEFDEMKKHALFGEEIISKLIEQNGPTSFLSHAKDIAGGHHEKWDGSGYPRGLKEEEIPLSARIMAIADVYDALTSKRVYKNEFTHKSAIAIIKDGKAKHFDPELVDAFLELNLEFKTIADTIKD
ncbi:HD domain-containing phosphohydrolase [Sulfurospirillum sp. 1307]